MLGIGDGYDGCDDGDGDGDNALSSSCVASMFVAA